MAAVQFPFEDSRDVLNLQLASLAGISSDIVDIILDLDYFLVQSNDIGLSEVSQWLDNAHKHIGDIFDASITDQLKQRFEE